MSIPNITAHQFSQFLSFWIFSKIIIVFTLNIEPVQQYRAYPCLCRDKLNASKGPQWSCEERKILKIQNERSNFEKSSEFWIFMEFSDFSLNFRICFGSFGIFWTWVVEGCLTISPPPRGRSTWSEHSIESNTPGLSLQNCETHFKWQRPHFNIFLFQFHVSFF